MPMPLLLIILLLIAPYKLAAADPWGPKFNLHFQNEVGNKARVVIGVDENATNEWDKNINFSFEDTTLTENNDLPPFPPAFAVYLIRDTLRNYDTYTYVDMRAIPANSEQFHHRYKALINWYLMSYPTHVDVSWGKLPAGIDSARFSCREWFVGTPPVDMIQNEQTRLDNQVYVNLYIDVWYNNSKSPIEETEQTKIHPVTPNPADNFITISGIDANRYYINDLAGNEVTLATQSTTADGCITININALNKGAYNLTIEQTNGKRKHFRFIKK